MRYVGYGCLLFFAVCVVVAVWQTWREEQAIADRRRAWFDAHDKLEGE